MRWSMSNALTLADAATRAEGAVTDLLYAAERGELLPVPTQRERGHFGRWRLPDCRMSADNGNLEKRGFAVRNALFRFVTAVL